jgi:diguanylate cyclase (GGDEF)-like protein
MPAHMQPTTARGARSRLGDALRPWRVPVGWIGVGDDPYLLYTATLIPVVLVVALIARRPGELWVAVALSSITLAVQTLLGIAGRRRRVNQRVAWQIVRLAPPLIFVALATRLIGGPSLPLIALYIPVVAAAAAAGAVQGTLAAGFAATVLLAPELEALGSSSAIALEGVTLAGVSLVLAFGTRRIMSALERALAAARAAVIAERRRARQIAALEEVGRLLAASGPTVELIDRAVEVVVGRFGYRFASVYLGDDRRVELAAQRGYLEALSAFDPSTGIAGRVMRTREIAFVPDVSAEPEYVPGTMPATSLICAPLIVDGRFLGILNVETSGGRRLDETDRTLVDIIATRIAIAVALGKDRQALAARANLFRDIEAFGRDVTSSLAIEPLAEMIIDATARVVPAEMLAVTLLDRASGRYLIRATRGVSDAAIGREIVVGEGLAGRAIRDRALVVDDAFTREGFPRSVQNLDVPEFTQGVGLPLVRDGVVVGALTIGRAAGRSGFSALELEGLQLLASSAALAVANAFLHAEVAESAVRDPLTGLYNRRHFDAALDRMLAAHRRERLGGWRPLSAIVFDLDRFGVFNKEHGHQVGDEVLRAFAEVLLSRFRGSDLVARLGGEEFIVVLDGADREQAVAAANEVRERLAARPIRAEDGAELRVTVSAGCAELDRAHATRDSLLRTADVALFMAKRAGRDRVVAA